jgi:hypothetical protein
MIELVGRAEMATAVKPETLETGAYGEAGHRRKKKNLIAHVRQTRPGLPHPTPLTTRATTGTYFLTANYSTMLGTMPFGTTPPSSIFSKPKAGGGQL